MRRNLTYKIKHINVSFFLENANTFLNQCHNVEGAFCYRGDKP